MLEPFVFIAILQLYIEFPAIQDLIYTRICFQVLSEYKFNSSNLVSQYQKPIVLNAIDLDVSKNATSFDNVLNNITISNINESSIDLNQICSRINKSAVPEYLRQKIPEQNSLFWFKYQLVTCALCALASPYWGGISDKIGRLIPMNAPVLASLLNNMFLLVYGILISLDSSYKLLDLNWLYACAVLVGLSGGQSVLISNSFGFLSDNTSNEERTKRVTTLESTIFLAHSFGFSLSKYIMPLGLGSGHISSIWKNRYFVAFGLGVLLNSICILYSILVLRHKKLHRFLNNFEREQQEQVAVAANSLAGPSSTINNGERLRELTASTPDDLDGPIVMADKSNWTIRDTMITFRYHKQTYSTAMKARESRSIILWLLFSTFISALSLTALMSLLFVYVKSEPFNWTTSQYSAWNALSSITRGSALIALTLCIKFYSNWSVPDPLVAALGFLSKFSGLLLIGLAQDGSHLYWALACLSLSELAMPPIRSLLSKLVPQEELCKIYGCIGSLQSVCFILGNIAFYLAFNYTLGGKDYYRIGFISASALELFAMIVMLIVYTSLRQRRIMI